MGAAAALPAWDGDGFADACRDGDIARVWELTSPEHMAAHSGVDLNWERTGTDTTGLCLACAYGHIKVVQHLTSPAMLAAGVDVNQGRGGCGTPLIAASLRLEVVRHLLESPDLAAAGITVDVNAANEWGMTALHQACRNNAPPEVVALLLRQPQLDLDARSMGLKTALQLADANKRPGGHGAEKAALIREARRLRMVRCVLVVAMCSRREGLAVGADATPALPDGTLDEEDEEARGRRRVMGGLPRFMLEAVCRLTSPA